MAKGNNVIIFTVLVLLLMASLSFGVQSAKAQTQTLSIQLGTIGDGQASLTNEKVHTSPYCAKLVIPSGASGDSCALALYPYNKPLSTLQSFSIYASYTNATPRFVIYLDTHNDGLTDIILLSDYQFVSDGSWQVTTGGLRWGWTQTNPQLSSYGQTWQPLNYWKSLYANSTVPYVGICLEYQAVYSQNGTGQPLYADEAVINGVTYTNIAGPTSTPSPTPISTSVPVGTPQPTTTPIPSIAPTQSSFPTATPVPSNPPISKPAPILNLTCSSSSSDLNFNVDIEGSLTYDNTGLSGSPILISYSLDGGNSWIELTYINAQEDGSFSAVWHPSVTGNFLLRAISLETTQFSQATTTVNLAVTPTDETNSVFSVSSNSTLSGLTFDSTTNELSFTVSGPSGTTGYVNVQVPNSLISDVSQLKVYLDGNQINYTATAQNDAWLFHFSYHHSTHKVTMALSPVATKPTGQSFGNWTLYAGIAAITVLLMSIAFFLRRKNNKNGKDNLLI